MDKKEYNRNYYYKRDPAKLKQYRDKYNKKIKKREYDRLRDSVISAERYFRNHGMFENKEKELLVQEFRKPKEYKSSYYAKTRERWAEHCSFNYRAKKLKEFVDNVLNNDDNIVNNYGQR